MINFLLYLRHSDSLNNKNEDICYTAANSVEGFWDIACIKTEVRQNSMLDVFELLNETLKKVD